MDEEDDKGLIEESNLVKTSTESIEVVCKPRPLVGKRRLHARRRTGSFAIHQSWPEGSLKLFVAQVFLPFFVCSLGNLGAGILLHSFQTWTVFSQMNELTILVPALMGLKGNLEMTMASRLSTAANCGFIDHHREIWSVAKGNLALLQCQATVIGFLASLFAIIADTVDEGHLQPLHSVFFACSSMLTANIASVSLSAVMIIVVIICRKKNINPDNVATPIASSLGDVTTVALLGGVSRLLYDNLEEYKWVLPAIMIFLLLLTPFTAHQAFRNEYTKRVICYGWVPLIIAMVISGMAGLILKKAITKFETISMYQLLINGVGGNLVAIQASRISTYLHQRFQCGELPEEEPSVCLWPCFAFIGRGPHSSVARILFLMALPSQTFYFVLITFIKGSKFESILSFQLGLIYMTVAILHILLLLYFARLLVFWLWKRKSDPDDSAIPILTGTGDLLGGSFLTLGFSIHSLLQN